MEVLTSSRPEMIGKRARLSFSRGTRCAPPPPQRKMTAGVLILLLLAIAILIFCSALFPDLRPRSFPSSRIKFAGLEKNHPSLSTIHQSVSRKSAPRSQRASARRRVRQCAVGRALSFSSVGRLARGRVPQWIAAIVIFAIVVLLCDLIPKLLALSAPYRLSTIGVFTLQYVMPLLDRVGTRIGNISARLSSMTSRRYICKRARDSATRNSRPGRDGRGGRHTARSGRRDDPGDHQARRQNGQGLHDAARRYFRAAG